MDAKMETHTTTPVAQICFKSPKRAMLLSLPALTLSPSSSRGGGPQPELFPLLLHNCNFAVFSNGLRRPLRKSLSLRRGRDPQVENH